MDLQEQFDLHWGQLEEIDQSVKKKIMAMTKASWEASDSDQEKVQTLSLIKNILSLKEDINEETKNKNGSFAMKEIIDQVFVSVVSVYGDLFNSVFKMSEQKAIDEFDKTIENINKTSSAVKFLAEISPKNKKSQINDEEVNKALDNGWEQMFNLYLSQKTHYSAYAVALLARIGGYKKEPSEKQIKKMKIFQDVLNQYGFDT